MLGMAIGDAVGAHLEFLPVTDVPSPDATFSLAAMVAESSKKSQRFGLLSGRSSTPIYTGTSNKFRLKEGQFTDDTSMGLCIADSYWRSRPRNLLIRSMAPIAENVSICGGILACAMRFASTPHAAPLWGLVATSHVPWGCSKLARSHPQPSGETTKMPATVVSCASGPYRSVFIGTWAKRGRSPFCPASRRTRKSNPPTT